MEYLKLFAFHTLLLCLMLCHSILNSQEVVPINSYDLNSNGQIQLVINSSPLNYYILQVRHNTTSTFEQASSMTIGSAGTTIITEPLGYYPIEHYRVLKYSTLSPADIDGDGINDIQEFNQMPIQNPLNPAAQVNSVDGLVGIDSFSTFKDLSTVEDVVQWSEYLNGKIFIKFIIVDFLTPNPKLYFINTETHSLHSDFSNTVGIDNVGDQVRRGNLIFHPTSISNNGTLGTFAFNFSGAVPEEFEYVQKAYELLGTNMPFLKNNLSYFITESNQEKYIEDSLFYEASRVSILLESDVYADVNYWGLNQSEGYGFFRQISLNEIPGNKDIVLYEALPNSLPRVGGIMTSVIQTPLSHVNLRAIQNNVPNAFIRDPLEIDSIASLLNHYIYFKVEQSKYIIREATVEEVNAWYEELRPKEEQSPPLNLSYTDIKSLDEINFEMFDGFGAKSANIATMRKFDFPEGTIPQGYAIPFYFYVEFMKFNNLYTEIDSIINLEAFKNDRLVRDYLLNNFREHIEDAAMPQWMWDELSELQTSFPISTPIRCRSSTNNEDLPGFNGAGLYESKTQHPDEGHISKSVKQVFASLWSLRAFEERDFYRINHFKTAMGVLCHPNYEDERMNGVGVSTDPIYGTENTFYLNSQLGEELITNPSATVIPEEILLDKVEDEGKDYVVVQRSNLIPSDSILFAEEYLSLMRIYLSKIHGEFAKLYKAENNPTFAMDIEYKITSDYRLIIKQARPWVSYVFQEQSLEINQNKDGIFLFPNPAQEYIAVQTFDENISGISIMDIRGKEILSLPIDGKENSIVYLHLEGLPAGIYIIHGIIGTKNYNYSKKFIKL
jgi:hypothetical protein